VPPHVITESLRPSASERETRYGRRIKGALDARVSALRTQSETHSGSAANSSNNAWAQHTAKIASASRWESWSLADVTAPNLNISRLALAASTTGLPMSYANKAETKSASVDSSVVRGEITPLQKSKTDPRKSMLGSSRACPLISMFVRGLLHLSPSSLDDWAAHRTMHALQYIYPSRETQGSRKAPRQIKQVNSKGTITEPNCGGGSNSHICPPCCGYSACSQRSLCLLGVQLDDLGNEGRMAAKAVKKRDLEEMSDASRGYSGSRRNRSSAARVRRRSRSRSTRGGKRYGPAPSWMTGGGEELPSWVTGRREGRPAIPSWASWVTGGRKMAGFSRPAVTHAYREPVPEAAATPALDSRKENLSAADTRTILSRNLKDWLKGDAAKIKIGGLLGKGGYGFVFGAEMESLPELLKPRCTGSGVIDRSGSGIVLKVISSEGMSDNGFVEDAIREFELARDLADKGVGPPVYCWDTFEVENSRNSYYEKGSQGSHQVKVKYFVIFMARMQSDLGAYTAAADQAQAMLAWREAAQQIKKASEDKKVFSDVKPENFLVSTKDNMKTGAPFVKTFLWDFDSRFIGNVETERGAWLANFVFFTASLLSHADTLGDKYHKKDGLYDLLPRYILLFISDMYRFYAASAKTVAFFGEIASLAEPSARYTGACPGGIDEGMSNQDNRGVARVYLRSYRKLCSERFSGRYHLLSVAPREINRAADAVFLGRGFNRPSGSHVVDFAAGGASPPGTDEAKGCRSKRASRTGRTQSKSSRPEQT
jgi:hypothetical protein